MLPDPLNRSQHGAPILSVRQIRSPFPLPFLLSPSPSSYRDLVKHRAFLCTASAAFAACLFPAFPTGCPAVRRCLTSQAVVATGPSTSTTRCAAVDLIPSVCAVLACLSACVLVVPKQGGARPLPAAAIRVSGRPHCTRTHRGRDESPVDITTASCLRFVHCCLPCGLSIHRHTGPGICRSAPVRLTVELQQQPASGASILVQMSCQALELHSCTATTTSAPIA